MEEKVDWKKEEIKRVIFLYRNATIQILLLKNLKSVGRNKSAKMRLAFNFFREVVIRLQNVKRFL